ncbi:MAG: hypothetical protein QM790_10050 [Nibricoccus sp.]
MNSLQQLLLSDGLTKRGTVLSVRPGEPVACKFGNADEESLPCDLLDNGTGQHLLLTVGDQVLVWQPTAAGERGIILGRICSPTEKSEKENRAQVVVEAGQELVLKCGKASIELSKDGTISIKGTDVISRARRVNRIKGSSVTLN